MGLGEAVEEVAGQEVALGVFRPWLVAQADSLRRYAAGHADSAVEAAARALEQPPEPDFDFAPIKEGPKQVVARVMKEILPGGGLTNAHINELIQAASHGVDFDTIRAIANPDLTLQQVRAARTAAERQVA